MKVLVPTDGSEHAMGAVQRAVEMAEKLGAAVTLLAVVQVSDFDDMTPNIREKVEREAREVLEKARALLAAKNLPVTTALEKGLVPANNILRKAEEEKFDRIVMGSTGSTGLVRILMGSTAAKVVAHAPCEVTIVH